MTARRAATRRRRGFTLIELMVVLAILSLAGMLAVPRLAAMTESGRFAAARERLLSEVRQARAQAIEQQRETMIEPRHLSARLGLPVTASPAEGVRFFADGSSTGGHLALAAGSRQTAVSIDWLTGRARLAE